MVEADGEHEYELAVGDTFAVRGETWVLDRVENISGADYRAFLERAG